MPSKGVDWATVGAAALVYLGGIGTGVFGKFADYWLSRRKDAHSRQLELMKQIQRNCVQVLDDVMKLAHESMLANVALVPPPVDTPPQEWAFLEQGVTNVNKDLALQIEQTTSKDARRDVARFLSWTTQSRSLMSQEEYTRWRDELAVRWRRANSSLGKAVRKYDR